MVASALEQLLLELVNDARLDPLGNAARYITSYSPLTSSDPDIQSAINFFGVNGPALLTAYTALASAEPLAWNENLATAAETHSQEMITANAQSHQLPGELGLGARISAAGYAYSSVGENIYAYADSMLYAHAGFMIDWGNATPGHRDNIMSTSYREIGLGVIQVATSYPDVGPNVVTEDLGNRPAISSSVILLGVGYNDNVIADDFYSVGEAISGLTVSVGGPSTTTAASGGYSLVTTATGSQTITFSGGGLASSITMLSNLVAGHNYKLDIVDAATAPMLETSVSGTVGGGVSIIKGLGVTGLTLTAGNGSQTMIGSKGADTLNGGGGADTFVAFAGMKSDTITGFSTAEGDRIDVSAYAGLHNAGDVLAISSGSTITFATGDKFTLSGVAISSLSNSAFKFAVPVGNAPTDIQLTNTLVSENAAVGATIGTLTATDADVGDTFTYSIVSPASTPFSISGNALKVAAPLDFETISSYAITLRVKDSGNNTYDEAFTIQLINATGATITGTAGNDTINATTTVPGQPLPTIEDDIIHGLGGNDTISGLAGDDKIEGGAGNDILDGGLGKDTVSYADTSSFSAVGVTVSLALTGAQDTKGAGKDTIKGFEVLEGSFWNDTLTGSKNADTIRGGGGFDVIEGGAGADDLDGESEADWLSYAKSALAVKVDLTLAQQAEFFSGTILNGDASKDKTANFENIRGSAKADVLIGDGTANVFEGGAGADIITGGGGADGLSYEHSTVGVTVDLALATAQGGLGDAKGDVLTGTFMTVYGSARNDTLSGTGGFEFIDGGLGDDWVEGRGGNDYLYGGGGTATTDGSDTVSYRGVGTGVSIDLNIQGGVKAQSNGDHLSGFENVVGTDFGDTLTGDHRSNIIDGGLGDDTISGGAGDDTLIGGGTTLAPDLDTLSYLDATAGVKVSLALTTAQVTGGAGTDTISGFEWLQGSNYNDVLTGDKFANFIYGEAGDDVLQGGEGADWLNGGKEIAVGDTVSYQASKLAVRIDLSAGTQAAFFSGTIANGDAAGDTLVGLENVTGSGKNDFILGDGNTNVIEGGLGNDELWGGGGVDTISYAGATGAVKFSLALQGSAQATGGGGTDTAYQFVNVTGGKGADKLTGDAFDNVLTGGLGADILEGGLGPDTFFYNALAEKGDHIKDFAAGFDMIALKASGFSGLAIGPLTDGFNFISAAGTGAPLATNATPTFLYDQDDGKLYYDANGSVTGGITLLLTLDNKAPLAATDFVVI